MATANPQGWCPFADTEHTSPNFWSGNSGRKAVVLHIAQGDYLNSRTWLTNPKSEVSSHFIIGPAGELSQMVSVHDSSWANGLWWDDPRRCWRAPRKVQTTAPVVTPSWPDITPRVNPNRQTISIEHAGRSGQAMSSAMFDALVRLLRWLAQQFPLEYVPGHTLIRHADINPLDKPFCPGTAFNFPRIAAAANAPIPAPALRRYAARVSCPVFEDRRPDAQLALDGQAVILAGQEVIADDLTAGWVHIAGSSPVFGNVGFAPVGALKEVK